MVDLDGQVDLLEFLKQGHFLYKSKPSFFWAAKYKKNIPLNTYLTVLFYY